MDKVRGFEHIKGFMEIELPMRKTCFSAGYDICAACNVLIEPGEVVLVPTGIKSYMQDDEYLAIHIRSSLAIKYKLALINSTGIIDKDYYNNIENDGHIMIGLINHGNQPFQIDKGARIAQGIFCKYLIADQDTNKNVRIGGIGRTGI